MSKQKLPFWELAHGRLAKEFQEIFEKAQMTARDRELPIQVKLSVTVSPPDKTDPMYGNISFTTSFHEPARRSKNYDTVLEDGFISKDAAEGGVQLDLGLEQPKNVAPIRKEAASE